MNKSKYVEINRDKIEIHGDIETVYQFISLSQCISIVSQSISTTISTLSQYYLNLSQQLSPL